MYLKVKRLFEITFSVPKGTYRAEGSVMFLASNYFCIATYEIISILFRIQATPCVAEQDKRYRNILQGATWYEGLKSFILALFECRLLAPNTEMINKPYKYHSIIDFL
jgi:hypothetical protein